MLRFLTSIILLIAVSAAIPAEAAPPKSVEKLRKEQQATKRKINETTKKLKTNTRETKRQLNRLETLRGDMERQNIVIAKARNTADSVDNAIRLLGDTIARMDTALVAMRTAYGKALRRLQTVGTSTTTLSFLMSSESFEQAYRRLRYLNQFSKWRKRKATQVKAAQEQLESKRHELAGLRRGHTEALQHLDLAARKLRQQKSETEKLVASLKKEEGNLRTILKDSEMRQRKLDNEIDRQIRAEQERQERQRREAEAKAKAKREAEAKAKAEAEKRRKAAESSASSSTGTDKKPAKAPDTKPAPKSGSKTETKPAEQTKPTPQIKEAEASRTLTGSFESNRGRLLFPVSGQYRVVKGFGRQPHPELKHVETENSGIDIEALNRGATARAIFEGTVSAIFKQPGFNNIVMIRHGSYISIYAGLSTLTVKNGQTVKAGQVLGQIATDPDNDNRAILHFELRRERQKLNPTLWVK